MHALHRYERNADDFPHIQFTVIVFCDQHQLLVHVRSPDRDHHAATGLELLEQWFGNVLCGCGDDDCIERRVFGPAIITVAGD